RGRDIMWWMQTAGVLDEGLDDIDDVNRARGLPSPQLVGAAAPTILDLNAMQDQGIQLVGRLMGIQNGIGQFSGSLKNVCQLADLKMNRLLGVVDEWVAENAEAGSVPEPERFERTRCDESPTLLLDFAAAGIETVLWATGFRPEYPWLDVPVLDRKGRVRHDGGVVVHPGLYIIGLPFLRRRKSSFIHGAEDDARFIAQHLADYLS
ncbi:MAG: pyridine nucleotide-disulfide oxidoreductase, partial [Verrucomicrobiota bacterium]